jgi:hypothetical protein
VLGTARSDELIPGNEVDTYTEQVSWRWRINSSS